jgi:hypothetical protein
MTPRCGELTTDERFPFRHADIPALHRLALVRVSHDDALTGEVNTALTIPAS